MISEFLDGLTPRERIDCLVVVCLLIGYLGVQVAKAIRRRGR
jgi:hypothetical protein